MTSRIKRLNLWLIAAICVFASATFAEQTQDAAKAFTEGNTLLKKGDFSGAKKAYALAAKTDTTKPEYRSQYSIVSRVIKNRESLAKEKSTEKWTSLATALRSFYLKNGIDTEALDISKKINEKLNTADSAVLLAEVQLQLNQNADAVKTLKSLDVKKTTPQTQTLIALAYAEEKQIEQAKSLAAKIVVPSGCELQTVIPARLSLC